MVKFVKNPQLLLVKICPIYEPTRSALGFKRAYQDAVARRASSVIRERDGLVA
jgi:hypothetical protein